MTVYVYQIMIGDKKYDEVNAKGWDGVTWGSDYHNITWDPAKNDDIDGLIDRVVDHGLVQHTMTIDSDDLDEIFACGNGHGDLSKVTTHRDCKSISVGDIIVDTNTNLGHMVGMFGFIPVSVQKIKEMQCKVTTSLRMGEPA